MEKKDVVGSFSSRNFQNSSSQMTERLYCERVFLCIYQILLFIL